MTTHRIEQTLNVGGNPMRVLEQGTGPLVLLLHGFPSLADMWHAQLTALAQHGFRAVAPTQRGLDGSHQPRDPREYSIFHLVGDLVALLDTLGEAQAYVVGHDWGSTIAWHCALLRPDRFRAVVGMSTPLTPRGNLLPTERMRQFAGENYFYPLYFQEPGVAEADFASMDLEQAFRRILHGASADATAGRWRPSGPRGTRLFDGSFDPGQPPPWLAPGQIALYAQAFGRSGFSGALGYYRAMDLSWALMSAFADLRVTVPALFLHGDRDPLLPYVRSAIAGLPALVPSLVASVRVPNAGHWLPQEQAEPVNRVLLEFLRGCA